VDLSHPITSITSPMTGLVLEVLAGTTRPLSASDIGRLVPERSRQGAAKALARLEEQGLVNADRRTSATYYTANREHLAWPAIQQLVGLRGTIRDRLVEEIAPWRVRAVHASMFGSAARGDADASSDIDLLLVRHERLSAQDEAAWEEQLHALRDRFRLLTGNRVQTFVLTPSRLLEHVQAEDPLVAAWLRDSITITGQPIARVIAGITT
jgi:predicted nucleotidyltransferase